MFLQVQREASPCSALPQWVVIIMIMINSNGGEDDDVVGYRWSEALLSGNGSIPHFIFFPYALTPLIAESIHISGV